MDSQFTIDLNHPPLGFDNELTEEGKISISLTNTPSGNFIIEVNEEHHDIEFPIMELDIQEFTNNNSEEDSDSSEDDMATHKTSQGNIPENKIRVLTNNERWAIYRALLQKSVDGKLKKNTTKEVQNMFNVESLRTVQRIWKIHKRTPPGIDVDVSSRKIKNCGRKRIEIDLSRIKEIELHKRTTLTSLSEALGVGYSKMYRLFKRGIIRRHSSAIKPYLKEGNKLARLEFCLSMLEESTMLGDLKFQGMYNYVHIDEKWFYMTKKDETYYLLDDENDPDRSCQSKNFIDKVMFLAATARPRFDDEGRVLFHGKIGCWPLVTLQPAKRTSRNRNAGTMEMKSITSVKRDTIRTFLVEKVIPAIHEKWPRSRENETIFIQQDNARTHVLTSDQEFLVAASQSGLDIRLFYQPPNSPDFNILDLEFFRAIQSLQQKIRATTIPELVDAVERAFDDYSPVKLNHVWLTLQLCLKESMKLNGGNRYKIPHINKKRLQRLGVLPTEIACEMTLVQTTRLFLHNGLGGSND